MATPTTKKATATPESIIRDVKAGKVAPVYLLSGTETFLIDRLEKQLLDALIPEEQRDFNLISARGGETTTDEVIMAARGFPMGAERLVVLVRDAHELQGFERFELYLKKPMPSTVLIINYRGAKLDKRMKVSALLEKTGVVYCAEPIQDHQIAHFIKQYTAEQGHDISDDATIMLGQLTGTDLGRVTSEVNKLIAFTTESDKQIGRELVQHYVNKTREHSIFELTDALAQKNREKAFLVMKYFDETPKDNPIQRTLAMLFRFYQNLMVAYYSKDRTERGLSNFLSISPWAVRNNVIPSLSRYKPREVMNILREIRRTDARSKGVDNEEQATNSELMQQLLYRILF